MEKDSGSENVLHNKTRFESINKSGVCFSKYKDERKDSIAHMTLGSTHNERLKRQHQAILSACRDCNNSANAHSHVIEESSVTGKAVFFLRHFSLSQLDFYCHNDLRWTELTNFSEFNNSAAITANFHHSKSMMATAESAALIIKKLDSTVTSSYHSEAKL